MLRVPPPPAVPIVGPEDREPSPALALARAASQGDERATRQLLEAVTPRVGRVVRVILGFGHPDCDDVAQLALIAFTQGLTAFRGECEPAHYASRIAVRTAVQARRRSRALRARFDDMSESEEPTTASVHDDALAERRKRIVRDLLGVIPPEQAEALALRVALGWTLEEIASASDTPLNTVRSRLRLAKEALRRRIDADPILRDELEVES
jgi:RNA polymerase sigma factor (sigma-70 family)